MAPWGQGPAVLLLAVLAVQLQHASGQWDGLMGTSDFTPEYRAATVVTNVWIGAFALASTIFGILGELSTSRTALNTEHAWASSGTHWMMLS